MDKLALSFLCLLLLPLTASSQESVSELPPAHASALQEFLTNHPELQFLSERKMDKETLKDMRKNFGARLTPYHRTGDFNRDGIQDFAMILAREGPPSEDLGRGIADTHRYLHDLALVIFNGQRRGGYKAAFVKNTTAPLVCFLYVTFEKKRRLYFAIYETDKHFIMTPAGKGYLVEDTGNTSVLGVDRTSDLQRAKQYIGKHSWEMFKGVPNLRRRLGLLLGSEYAYFMKGLSGPQGPIRVEDGMMVVTACAAHACPEEQAALAIDL